MLKKQESDVIGQTGREAIRRDIQSCLELAAAKARRISEVLDSRYSPAPGSVPAEVFTLALDLLSSLGRAVRVGWSHRDYETLLESLGMALALAQCLPGATAPDIPRVRMAAKSLDYRLRVHASMVAREKEEPWDAKTA